MNRFLAGRAERQALRIARVVVCNSRRTARDVVERLRVDPDRVKVVYLGSDPDQFPPITLAERAKARSGLAGLTARGRSSSRSRGHAEGVRHSVLGVARPVPRSAVGCESRGRWGWGRAPHLEGAHSSDGLASRICFLGFRTDVPCILAAADLMVHPARYEAYGLGVHEALCRGLPAIVSAAAGVTERIPPTSPT